MKKHRRGATMQRTAGWSVMKIGGFVALGHFPEPWDIVPQLFVHVQLRRFLQSDELELGSL
jgi:hypothetical protein